ncbi:MAG: flagellar basal-body MS-ring/collar protein FliF, partial [Acidimicrobiales bacterium]
AATALGVFLVAKTTSSTPMSTLYTDLEATAAADITAELDAQGVPYELLNGGRVIQVPAGQVHNLRLNLSAQGLPNSDGGWSILDNQGITTSAFEQRVGYQRAMEGELARTISAIDGVSSANVHLAIPEHDLIVDDGKQATASVLLVTGSTTISPMQVDAIVNLVASSIEGLSPDQVSVADASGRVLAAPGEGSGVVGLEGDTQLRARREFESVMENDLEALLALVVGPGHAVVNVAAELDFDSVVTVTEEYRPNESPAGDQVKLAETTRAEIFRGDDAATEEGGELEIELPEDEENTDGDTADTDTGVDYSLDEQDVTYAVDKVITNASNAVGTVTSLSVAVLLDEAAVDAERVADLQTLVETAAGISTDRGDSVAVTLMPLNETVMASIDAANATGELVAEEAAAGGGLDIIGLARTVGTVVIALVVLILGLKYVSRGSKRKVIDSVDLNELEAGSVAAIGSGATAAEAADDGEPPELKLQSLIANQTDDVAEVLRSWLNEAEEVAR